jgi:predicted glycoside hydrolase/deacetylase ChbG (UPF0249 family)
MAEAEKSQFKGVIVCADDFAFNASVSCGIAKLAAMGRISATSVMVLSDRWHQDVSLLRPMRGRIDVGLHLDWTSAFAVAAGHGLSLGAAMRRALLGGFDIDQASSVIERQLDLFEEKWQSPPDYVDGHQHVQQFAGIREALVDVLARRYCTEVRRPYLRISRPPKGMGGLKSKMIAWMGGDALEKLACSAGFTVTSALLGVYDFLGNPMRFGGLMVRWLAQAPVGSVIMCHPSQAVEPNDEIGFARAQEYLYLGSDEFLEILDLNHVKICRGEIVGNS